MSKKRKKIDKPEMYPGKTIPMQFNDKVAPMPMCGESRLVSFSEWRKKMKDKKH